MSFKLYYKRHLASPFTLSGCSFAAAPAMPMSRPAGSCAASRALARADGLNPVGTTSDPIPASLISRSVSDSAKLSDRRVFATLRSVKLYSMRTGQIRRYERLHYMHELS